MPVACPPTPWRHMLGNGTLWLLFATGLTSMGLEVVWTRLYTIFVGTFVYSFATILGVYLAATFIGSTVYRIWSRRHPTESPLVWLFVWLAAITPLLTADMRVAIPAVAARPSRHRCLQRPARISDSAPRRPFLRRRSRPRRLRLRRERRRMHPRPTGRRLCSYCLISMSATPWRLWRSPGCWSACRSAFVRTARFIQKRLAKPAPARHCRRPILLASFALVSPGRAATSSEIAGGQVRRDSTATVIAAGQGMDKRLFVNGISMTILTPITKMMSAMPLAFLDRTPQNALVICFGMGTTHRSMLSWGIDSTVVDLVPSVPKLFWYYHADAPQLLEVAALPRRRRRWPSFS